MYTAWGTPANAHCSLHVRGCVALTLHVAVSASFYAAAAELASAWCGVLMEMGTPTSGVNMERGTRVQKKPRETQCVANLRMPK